MDQRDDDVPPGAGEGWSEADEEEFRRSHPRPPTSSDEELLEAETQAIVSQLDDAARLGARIRRLVAGVVHASRLVGADSWTIVARADAP